MTHKTEDTAIAFGIPVICGAASALSAALAFTVASQAWHIGAAAFLGAIAGWIFAVVVFVGD